MRGDRVLSEKLGQLMRHTLGQPARIDEDQRAAVLFDQLGHTFINLFPLILTG